MLTLSLFRKSELIFSKYFNHKVLYLICFLGLTETAFSFSIKDSFYLKGEISGKEFGKIFLKYTNDKNLWILDSAKINRGKFRFIGKVNQYTDVVYLCLDPLNKDISTDSNSTRMELDNSKMFIKLSEGKFKNFKLVGCTSLVNYQKHQFSLKKYLNQLDSLQILNEKGLDKDSFKSQELKILSKIKKINEFFFNNNLNSNISPRILFEWESDIDDVKFEKFYHQMAKIQKESFYGLKIRKLIGKRRLVTKQVGSKIPLFYMTNSFNEKTSIDTFLIQKKYVLLNFWATWCVPCRNSHPQLNLLYKKYVNDGFDIIAIADNDNDSSTWKNVISNDSISTWQNILRGRNGEKTDFKTDLAKLFNVDFYPTYILVDNFGLVLGRFADDITLMIKLKEVYKY